MPRTGRPGEWKRWNRTGSGLLYVYVADGQVHAWRHSTSHICIQATEMALATISDDLLWIRLFLFYREIYSRFYSQEYLQQQSVMAIVEQTQWRD